MPKLECKNCGNTDTFKRFYTYQYSIDVDGLDKVPIGSYKEALGETEEDYTYTCKECDFSVEPKED